MAIGCMLYAGQGLRRGNGGLEFRLSPVFSLIGVVARVLLAERLFVTAIHGVTDTLVRRNARGTENRRGQDAGDDDEYQDGFAHNSR